MGLSLGHGSGGQRMWVLIDKGEQGTWPYKLEGIGTRTKGAVGIEWVGARDQPKDPLAVSLVSPQLLGQLSPMGWVPWGCRRL